VNIEGRRYIMKIIYLICMLIAVILGTTGIIESDRAIMTMIYILFMYILMKER